MEKKASCLAAAGKQDAPCIQTEFCYNDCRNLTESWYLYDADQHLYAG